MLPLDGAAGGAAGASSDADHSHSDTAWRLSHLKRSVLKNIDSPLIISDDAVAPAPDSAGTFFGRAFESSARMAASLFSDLALNGQVNFVTTGSFDGLVGSPVAEHLCGGQCRLRGAGRADGRPGELGRPRRHDARGTSARGSSRAR